MNFKRLLNFLSKLSKNNTKEWFESNRKEYEDLRGEFLLFLDKAIVDMAKFDPQITGIEAKKTTFRINRDVRFSPNKRPYKANFGASIKADGKKSSFAGYYFHVEPGKSFLAGGLYLPDAPILQKVREEIDYNENDFRKILSNKSFKTYFKTLQGDQLKNPPKGFDKEHTAIDLLKYKSYLMVHSLSDKDLMDPSFEKKMLLVFKAMLPLIHYLNKAISYTQE